jgi:hypothetical protein
MFKKRDLKITRGEFGEILCTDILEKFFDYIIPFYKLRVANINPDLSEHGIDVYGIKMKDDEISEISFIESKVRTNYEENILIEALDQLDNYFQDSLVDWHEFCLKQFFSTKSNYFEPFMRYLNNRLDLQHIYSFKLFLNIDKESWDDWIITNLSDSEKTLPKLEVLIIQVQKLAEFIHYIYENQCNIRICDEDGE